MRDQRAACNSSRLRRVSRDVVERKQEDRRRTRKEDAEPRRTGLSGRPSMSRDATRRSINVWHRQQTPRTYPDGMKLVPEMLKRIVRERLQRNARNAREHPHRALREPLSPDATHHLWQRERVHPRWLLESKTPDGEDVDRGDEEIGEPLECGDVDRERGGHGVGSDGAALGSGVGRGRLGFGEVIAIVVCGAENDEKFE
jgi:hypothetical protein